MRRPLLSWQKRYVDAIIFRDTSRGKTLGIWHGHVADTLGVENERLTNYVRNRLNRARGGAKGDGESGQMPSADS